MKRIFVITLALSTLLFSVKGFAQQINLINPNMTPAEAVEDVLLGAGIDAFNITVNGSAGTANTVQPYVRHFNDGGGAFPIPEGVVLNTSGVPGGSPGQLPYGDSDLEALCGQTSGAFSGPQNGVIIEFDFVPAGDTLSFDYMFASNEYTSWTCSDYNDVFGFFISGPGISGPYSNGAQNLAIIPGSDTIPGNPNGTPVGINTVNSGVATGGSSSNCSNANPNWLIDSQYWTDQYNTELGSISGNYNGETVVLAANSNLVCNDTFHIKMAIANVNDSGLNSGVLLAANSFSSEAVDISIEASTTALDTLLIEGCTEGTVYFSRPESMSDDTLSINFDVGGTATQGDDFPQLASGDSIVLFPGETVDSLVIAPIQDSIAEGKESVIISAYTVNECGDTIVSEGIIWIDDEPHSEVFSTDTTVLCSLDSIPLGAITEDDTHFVPYSYSWYEIGTQDSIFGDTVKFKVDKNDSLVEYLVTSTDDCGFQYTDTASILLNQQLEIDTLIQNKASCGENDGSVVGSANGITGTPTYVWTSSIVDTIPGDSTSSTAWPNLSPGWYYFSVEDDVCKVLDSIQVEQDPPPEASFEADPTEGFAPLDVTFTNTSEDAQTYIWDFGNGDGVTVNNKDDQSSVYIEEGTYTVTLTTESGSCSDNTTKEITVTLPAIYDTPNVFTPNGDGDNDFFTINAENITDLEIVILNRWGNVIYESNDINFKWDGTTQSGKDVSDGTYFYKFKLVDLAGKEFSEEGFVHVVRE